MTVDAACPSRGSTPPGKGSSRPAGTGAAVGADFVLDPQAALYQVLLDLFGVESGVDIRHLHCPGRDGTFAWRQAGAEVVREPTGQLYGVGDCAVHDPAGNPTGIQELR
ncbi:glyoxalase [Streptomyces sp. NPDC050997]|uniref:glyoxalase n=1 Tax=Streptomyces sp. NPDC050997 TaxID=3155519 RepID=UPI003415DD41